MKNIFIFILLTVNILSYDICYLNAKIDKYSTLNYQDKAIEIIVKQIDNEIILIAPGIIETLKKVDTMHTKNNKLIVIYENKDYTLMIFNNLQTGVKIVANNIILNYSNCKKNEI